MPVLQVQKLHVLSYDIEVLISEVLYVPSYNSMDAYPVNVKIYDYFSYQEVVNALRVEVKVDLTMEIIVLIVNHDHP